MGNLNKRTNKIKQNKTKNKNHLTENRLVVTRGGGGQLFDD